VPKPPFLAVDAVIGIAQLPGKQKHLYRHPNVVHAPYTGRRYGGQLRQCLEKGEKSWLGMLSVYCFGIVAAGKHAAVRKWTTPGSCRKSPEPHRFQGL
jgi:hypothetical protein